MGRAIDDDYTAVIPSTRGGFLGQKSDFGVVKEGEKGGFSKFLKSSLGLFQKVVYYFATKMFPHVQRQNSHSRDGKVRRSGFYVNGVGYVDGASAVCSRPDCELWFWGSDGVGDAGACGGV
jgi:hypothetical protein